MDGLDDTDEPNSALNSPQKEVVKKEETLTTVEKENDTSTEAAPSKQKEVAPSTAASENKNEGKMADVMEPEKEEAMALRSVWVKNMRTGTKAAELKVRESVLDRETHEIVCEMKRVSVGEDERACDTERVSVVVSGTLHGIRSRSEGESVHGEGKGRVLVCGIRDDVLCGRCRQDCEESPLCHHQGSCSRRFQGERETNEDE